MSRGIDYGHGLTNIDRSNGIRYGVISQNAVAQAWSDSSEPDYGEATCPKCGNDALTYDATKHESLEQYEHGCADYACESCEISFDSSDAFPEEPIDWHCTDSDYEISSCLDSDLIITKSPYFTRAAFCSPCVPGACSIESPCDDGAECYCLGHDWFEEGVAPYPVYSVETRQLVNP